MDMPTMGIQTKPPLLTRPIPFGYQTTLGQNPNDTSYSQYRKAVLAIL